MQRRMATIATSALLVAGSFAFGAVVRPSVAQAKKKKKKVDLKKSFDHSSHFKELRPEGDRLLNCNDCHALTDAQGGKENYAICKKPRMPFPTHESCTPCHKKAFFKKPLLICTNCHTTNTFGKKPPMKEQTPKFAPLRTLFSHKMHLASNERVQKRFKFKKDCTFCHKFVRGGEKVLLPGHAQCCDCHTREGVEPNQNNCAGCHARPSGERARNSKIKKFSHADHSLDPQTGQTLSCMRCHGAVKRASKVKTIKKPVMEACVDCHDGKVAFDYAQCLKCHSKSISEEPVPESHKEGAERAKKANQ